MPFYPGPGLGGHCIPIDPIYLSWKCKQVGFDCKFISLAEKINSDIPKKISDEVVKLSKNKKNFKVLIVGAAYKKNIDDYRESPSLFVLNKILKKKIKVDYHDKFVKFITPNRHFPNLVGLKSVTLNYKKLSKYSLVLLLTDHDYIDYKLLKKYSKMLIDTRGKLSGTNVLKM